MSPQDRAHYPVFILAAYNAVMDMDFQSFRQLQPAASAERIELHILSLEKDCWYLLCVAGTDRVERHHCQGPLVSRALARAQAARVASALLQRGFQQETAGAHWQLDAWRLRRMLLERRAGNHVNCMFEEDQVWPWPGK
ncbi:hypothetical protein A11A3_15607 [Alcanivorax hongdengensis A-11-3]|uniref:Uncharacterized protein n=2 Tax=Alcanivorax hongdengensis TaxID=519051 RepID=L0W813_9GAMM|nr:hypothetical protein A11A3_15607 [Alcanivorax hongdengensis A-11-3]